MRLYLWSIMCWHVGLTLEAIENLLDSVRYSKAKQKFLHNTFYMGVSAFPSVKWIEPFLFFAAPKWICSSHYDLRIATRAFLRNQTKKPVHWETLRLQLKLTSDVCAKVHLLWCTWGHQMIQWCQTSDTLTRGHSHAADQASACAPAALVRGISCPNWATPRFSLLALCLRCPSSCLLPVMPSAKSCLPDSAASCWSEKPWCCLGRLFWLIH